MSAYFSEETLPLTDGRPPLVVGFEALVCQPVVSGRDQLGALSSVAMVFALYLILRLAVPLIASTISASKQGLAAS